MGESKENPGKRAAILEAALDLIAVGGFHGSPTAKIAQKAGVGIGSIYRYFSSKEDLIQALFTDLAEKPDRPSCKTWTTVRRPRNNSSIS